MPTDPPPNGTCASDFKFLVNYPNLWHYGAMCLISPGPSSICQSPHADSSPTLCSGLMQSFLPRKLAAISWHYAPNGVALTTDGHISPLIISFVHFYFECLSQDMGSGNSRIPMQSRFPIGLHRLCAAVAEGREKNYLQSQQTMRPWKELQHLDGIFKMACWVRCLRDDSCQTDERQKQRSSLTCHLAAEHQSLFLLALSLILWYARFLYIYGRKRALNKGDL